MVVPTKLAIATLRIDALLETVVFKLSKPPASDSCRLSQFLQHNRSMAHSSATIHIDLGPSRQPSHRFDRHPPRSKRIASIAYSAPQTFNTTRRRLYPARTNRESGIPDDQQVEFYRDYIFPVIKAAGRILDLRAWVVAGGMI